MMAVAFKIFMSKVFLVYLQLKACCYLPIPYESIKRGKMLIKRKNISKKTADRKILLQNTDQTPLKKFGMRRASRIRFYQANRKFFRYSAPTFALSSGVESS